MFNSSRLGPLTTGNIGLMGRSDVAQKLVWFLFVVLFETRREVALQANRTKLDLRNVRTLGTRQRELLLPLGQKATR